MKLSERKLFNEIVRFIRKPDYDQIDKGISLLRESPITAFFELILENCRIENGKFIASMKFTVRESLQPYMDYALWNVTGLAPKNLNIHQSLLRENVKSVRSRDYFNAYVKRFSMNRFPIEITNFHKLELLELHNSQMKNFPEECSKLKELKTLIITGNEIHEFPKPVLNMTDLQHLDLSSNQITELPADIGNLKHLLTLNLASNRLSSIPETISGFANPNKFEQEKKASIDSHSAMPGLKKLQTLKLNGNVMEEFPHAILQLSTLTSLDLSYNNIKNLPDEIGNLQSLRSLILTQNRMHTINPNIAMLHNLQQLHLGMMEITNPVPKRRYLNTPEMVAEYLRSVRIVHKLEKRNARGRKKTATRNPEATLQKQDNKIKINSNNYEQEDPIVSNISNYLFSKNPEVIDAGLSIMAAVGSQKVYDYFLRCCKAENGMLGHEDYSKDFLRYRSIYRLQNFPENNENVLYTVLNMIAFADASIKIQDSIRRENVKALNLDIRDLRNFEAIKKFTALETLRINFQNQNFNDHLYYFSQLQTFCIFELANLDTVNFNVFKNLNKLVVNDSRSTKTLNLSNFGQLSSLILKGSTAKTIIIENNPMLEELFLYSIKCEQLQISNCPNLRKLNIAHTAPLNQVLLSDFPNLREINIHFAQIDNLMHFLSRQISLEKVEINEDRTFKLDEKIGNLKNLKLLQITKTALRKIPEEIFQMVKLEHLILKDNHLSEIPENIGELKNLKTLILTNNQLKKIPASLGKCPMLEVLDLSQQSGKSRSASTLTTLPIEIFQNTSLSKVMVSWLQVNWRKFEAKLSSAGLPDKIKLLHNN